MTDATNQEIYPNLVERLELLEERVFGLGRDHEDDLCDDCKEAQNFCYPNQEILEDINFLKDNLSYVIAVVKTIRLESKLGRSIIFKTDVMRQVGEIVCRLGFMKNMIERNISVE